jgi:hypothetical protein
MINNCKENESMRRLILDMLNSGMSISEIKESFDKILEEEDYRREFVDTVAAAVEKFIQSMYSDVADLYDEETFQMFADADVLGKVEYDAQELRKLKSAGYEKAAPWEVPGPGPTLKVTKAPTKPAAAKDDDDILKVWSASL